MAKVVTTITTIYDTETKEVTEYRITTEKTQNGDFFGVAPSLLQLEPFTRYTDSICAKCETKIAVQVEHYVAGSNYCHACAMSKLGV